MSYHPYSNAYFPAAPVMEIRLGAPGAEVTLGPIEALVDTGADATLIPMSHLNQVSAMKVDQANMRSQWGECRSVSIYSVALEVDDHRFSATWVIGDELGNEVVLGRNVLNRLRLLLDGPAAMTEVLKARRSS
jgi:predicted aspartyl protease